MDNNIVQYVPFSSFVHSSFWYKLAEVKIEIDRLNDTSRRINGSYSNFEALKTIVEVEYTAFNSTFVPPKNSFPCHGVLFNKNTIEEFRESDKLALIKTEGGYLKDIINSGEWIQDASLLIRFLILSFADLKKYNFYYCFAFPVPLFENALLIQKNIPIEIDQLTEAVSKTDKVAPFFLLQTQDGKSAYYTLDNFIKKGDTDNNFAEIDLETILFGFADPSDDINPGWPLRVFLFALMTHCPLICGKIIKIVSLKASKSEGYSKSHCFSIQLPNQLPAEETMQWLGWELNDKGKFAPKLASMATSMDPQKLAENQINLNLKLMKWRLLPELNLEAVADLKCLIFGAGTLGCGVARSLLAWGVTHITFVDSGNVSFTNPVRQSLYTYDDGLKRRPKAETAAKRILEIHPGAITTGHSLHIPMPGHSVGESMMEQVKTDFEKIEELVMNHDVIFLLTDSRESRWLPTVLGCAYDKIVLNAALGFDSYLVMRHGSRKTVEPEAPVQIPGLKCLPGSELGCYFCNDIVAPRNSLKDRTLDQQCTVTRPAVSNIASSLAVELLVALVQHEKRELAPAFYRHHKSDTDIPEGILGMVPHSVRALLTNYEQVAPAVEKFSKCIACSEIIMSSFRKDGFEFCLQVFNSTKFLEDLTGITALLEEEQDIFACSANDEFEFSD